METLEHFVLNKNLPTYDYGEYLDCLHKEVARDARAEGLAQGHAEGLEQGLEQGHTAGLEEGKLDSALKMINSGISVEKTSEILELDINKLKSLIEK